MQPNGHVIITESSNNLRALGRQALVGNWKKAIIAAVLYTVCVSLPAIVIYAPYYEAVMALSENKILTEEFYVKLIEDSSQYSSFASLYMLLVTGAFNLGISMFFIALFRRKPCDYTQVFGGFTHFFKALGLLLMTGIMVFLWMLLLIVPGIIAAFRYSQAFLILADDPSKGVMQCISESKQLMVGNKWKYFCMLLSFIGWALFTGMAVSTIAGIFMRFTETGLAFSIINWICGLGACWLTAYMYSTKIAFFDILTGKLRPETERPQMTAAAEQPRGSDVS